MSVPTLDILDWLGADSAPDGTPRELVEVVRAHARKVLPNDRIDCALLRRRPGDDPRPDIDEDIDIIEVFRWKTIVDEVTDPTSEVSLEDLPAGVRANRKVGQPWYEDVVHILAPRRRGSRPGA